MYDVTTQFFPQFLAFKMADEAFRANLSTSAIHRRCAGDPLAQIAEHCQLQPATTSQVGLRDMRSRLYNLHLTYNKLTVSYLQREKRTLTNSFIQGVFKA